MRDQSLRKIEAPDPGAAPSAGVAPFVRPTAALLEGGFVRPTAALLEGVALCDAVAAAVAGPVVALALASDGRAPDWVHLLPLGEIDAVDGRKWSLAAADVAALIAQSLPAGGEELAIDYDHAIDRAAPQGLSARAAGWIAELQVRPDGIWGRVKWTDAGAAAIAAREYRFLSPVFRYTPTGQVRQLLRAALTNNPALPQLTALAAADLAPQETTMDLAKLRTALNLPADADEAAILAASSALTAVAGAARRGLALADAAGADDVTRAIAGRADQTVVATLQAEVTKLQQAEANRIASELVEKAIASGQILPATRDHWVKLALTDAEFVRTFIATQPPVVPLGERTALASALPTSGDAILTASDKALCASMGLTEEAFLSARKAEIAERQARAGGTF